MDLWFLLDGSGSVRAHNFKTCLKFVDQTASIFDISPDKVRTGLMIYSSGQVIRSYFNEHQSNRAFSQVVRSTKFPSGMIFLMCG